MPVNPVIGLLAHVVANPVFERDAAKARRPSTLLWESKENM